MTEAGGDHWVRWHAAYEDPTSALSVRLALVQSGVRAALDERPAGPITVLSLCAGQGRDVIEVVAVHQRRADVRAVLVELHPGLATEARERVAATGLARQVEVREADASVAASFLDVMPADVVVICGVFGNITPADIRRTIGLLSRVGAPGGSVVWTRHRRPPDLTPSVRAWFAEAGMAEASFVAPASHVLCVGRHRLGPHSAGGEDGTGIDGPGARVGLAPEVRLFTFVGDGSRPA